MENRCVCCGEIIPEGAQVCGNCTGKANEQMDAVRSLMSLPATDGNFISVLSRATVNQIRIAIENMERGTGHNKSRIAACKRELRKRDKDQNK